MTRPAVSAQSALPLRAAGVACTTGIGIAYSASYNAGMSAPHPDSSLSDPQDSLASPAPLTLPPSSAGLQWGGFVWSLPELVAIGSQGGVIDSDGQVVSALEMALGVGIGPFLSLREIRRSAHDGSVVSSHYCDSVQVAVSWIEFNRRP